MTGSWPGSGLVPSFAEPSIIYPVVGPIELAPGRADPWVAVANLVPSDRPPREIHVNVHSERFLAEDEPSPDVREHAVRSQPGQRLWSVFDDAAISGKPLAYRMQREDPELQARLEREWEGDGLRSRAREGKVVWCADDVRELARRAGTDADGLAREVDGWNEAVRAAMTRSAAGISAGPIEHPPYYALSSSATTFLTGGGLALDGQLRVLDGTGKPIPGLYAAGEILGAAALMGGTILGGMMVTSAISFGRILGRCLPCGPAGSTAGV